MPEKIKATSLRILPTPKELTVTGESFPLALTLWTDTEAFRPALAVFSAYFTKLHRKKPKPVSSGAAIRLLCNRLLREEEYILTARDGAVTLEAAAPVGANHALSALLQLIGSDGHVPSVTVRDYPDCFYRSLHVDVARSRHPLDILLKYIDLCWLYRVCIFHIHFTEAMYYTLPSRIMPELASPGHEYTFDDIRALREYAAARGVELMPEIDVPGHCLPFCRRHPEIFGDSNIIPLTHKAMDPVKSLIAELCEMFPESRFIHIGGDEADIAYWTEHEESRAMAEEAGIDFDDSDRRHLAERLLCLFDRTMADVVKSYGKQPVVWEGFSREVNDDIPRDILVESWENYYQITPDLLDAGFTVINASWRPMYIVTPDKFWPPEDVLDWSVRKWTGVHGKSPFKGKTYEAPDTCQIAGGELLAWGDRIELRYPNVAEGVAYELQLICERLPFLAENTWNREKRTRSNVLRRWRQVRKLADSIVKTSKK